MFENIRGTELDFKSSFFSGKSWQSWEACVLSACYASQKNHIHAWERIWIEQLLNQRKSKAGGGLIFFVLPLERLIILKKEDKGTVDFKLKGYVVVSFSALYYLSSIYVLLWNTAGCTDLITQLLWRLEICVAKRSLLHVSSGFKAKWHSLKLMVVGKAALR